MENRAERRKREREMKRKKGKSKTHALPVQEGSFESMEGIMPKEDEDFLESFLSRKKHSSSEWEQTQEILSSHLLFSGLPIPHDPELVNYGHYLCNPHGELLVFTSPEKAWRYLYENGHVGDNSIIQFMKVSFEGLIDDAHESGRRFLINPVIDGRGFCFMYNPEIEILSTILVFSPRTRTSL